MTANNTQLQLIGQKFILGFSGKSLNDPGVAQMIDLAKKKLIGGIILFAHNIESSAQLKQLTESFRQANADLIISVDQEGGKVQRLSAKNGFKDFKSAKDVGRLKEGEAFAHYLEMAQILAIHGINLNFAPTVDLLDINCPVIAGYYRSFSHDANEVIKYAQIFIEAHKEHNVSTCIKHFPGHGFSRSDSHKGLVDITSYANPEIELLPFKALATQVDYVMSAHVINAKYDPHFPATLSDHYIKPILREEFNFTGKVVSDDIIMGAILEQFEITEACALALQAGCDYITLSFHPLAMGKVKLPENFSYLGLLEALSPRLNDAGLLSPAGELAIDGEL